MEQNLAYKWHSQNQHFLLDFGARKNIDSKNMAKQGIHDHLGVSYA
jgi:hypothetical protein